MSNDRDKAFRIVINDDGDWPRLSANDVQEEIGKSSEWDKSKNVRLLTVMFGMMFLLCLIYAMKQGDSEMVREGFDFVKLTLAASISWTFGRWSLP